MTETTPSLYEIITIALAKTFRDGEVGFTGLTTGKEAVRYGTSMPLAAMAFARETHAPNLTILLAGWSVNPEVSALTELPDLEFAHSLLSVPAEAHVTGYPSAIGYKRGDVDFGFSSGVQLDRHGSLNTVTVGEYAHPKVRLVGAILLPEHFTQFRREVVMMPRHDARTFVPEVDFRAGLGHVPGRDSLGLPPGSGPALVVSPLGIFDFSGPERTMSAVSIHPGVDRDDVAASTGFELHNLAEAPVTATPTAEELDTLRQRVDPREILVPSSTTEGAADA